MDSLPLENIRVIDLSHSWAAPHAARLLADFGAEVIKVEYPKRLCLLRGARKDNYWYNNHPAWHQVNRNKLSITLDLQKESNRTILSELLTESDVLIENSRPGVMARLGFAYEDIVKFKEDIIMLSMSAFGCNGPYDSYCGYGAVFEAISGLQSLTTYEADGKPYRIRELDVTNGVAGAGAVMTALIHRQMTGQGQHIDFSQLEAATHATIGEHLLEYAKNGVCMHAAGNRHRYHAPQGCYRCKNEDSWIAITIRTEDEWQKLCQVTGHLEWVSDPRFLDREKRQKNHDDLDEAIESWTRELDCNEVMLLLQGVKIPAGEVLDMKGVTENSHLCERNYFIMSGGENNKKFMGTPFQLSRAPAQVKWPGPNLGEHNNYVSSTFLKRPLGGIKTYDEDEIGTAFDVD